MGENVNPSSTLVQATLALDKAALIAQTEKDVDALISIAKVWMDISHYISNIPPDSSGENVKSEHKSSFGFTPTEITAKD